MLGPEAGELLPTPRQALSGCMMLLNGLVVSLLSLFLSQDTDPDDEVDIAAFGFLGGAMIYVIALRVLS